MRSISGILALVAALALGAGCKGTKAGATGGGGQGKMQAALATIAPKRNSTVTGTVTFTPSAGDRVLVNIRVAGATPGLHGVSLHEKGDCSAPDANSAGDLWKPSTKQQGAPNPADLGNIRVGQNGRGSSTIIVSGLSVGGDHDVLNKSVVITDQPTGGTPGGVMGSGQGGTGTGGQMGGGQGGGQMGGGTQGGGTQGGGQGGTGGQMGGGQGGTGTGSQPSGTTAGGTGTTAQPQGQPQRVGCGVVRAWSGPTMPSPGATPGTNRPE
ncbi:MAG TPA: superoxide dismutase family protein [Polyangia bacterium]